MCIQRSSLRPPIILIPPKSVPSSWRGPDPDQDLLDRLETKETRNTKSVMGVIAAISILAGLIGFFSLQFELHSGQEASLDGGVLIAIAAAAGLFVAYRKVR